MTEVQIMAITDHKSTTSLQKYINNSIIQKRTASKAFSISGVGKENIKQSNNNIPQASKEIIVNKKSGRGNIEIILNNSTVTNLKKSLKMIIITKTKGKKKMMIMNDEFIYIYIVKLIYSSSNVQYIYTIYIL